MATNLTAIISADTAGFIKNVRQARQQLNDWVSQTRAQSKDVKKVTQEQANAYARVLDAMDRISTGNKDTATTTKQLTKQVQELKIQYANLSDEAKAGEFGQAMKKQIEQASSQLDKLNTQMEQSAQSMKKVGQTGTGGGLDSMTGQFKGLIDMAEQFGVKGAGSVNTVIGKMEGLGGTASKLGPLLTNPWVAAAAAIVSAGVALVNYDQKLQASLKQVKKMTGVTGDDLHQLRAGIQSLADVYGGEFSAQLTAVNNLMQKFGITGREAVDAISSGLSKGVSDVGAYLKNVEELSGSFADAGINANEFTNLLAKMNTGLISEDSFSIMQNGFKNIAKMESGLVNALSAIGIDAAKLQQDINSGALTTAQALAQITMAIGQVDASSSAAQNAIRTCFEEEGQRAGYAMVTALGDVINEMDNTTDATNDYQRAIQQCQRADEELEAACDEVFSMGVDWKTLGATIEAGCYSILVDLVKILGTCKDVIVIFCRTGISWVERLTNAISDTAEALNSLLHLSWSDFLSNLKKAGQELYSMGTDYGSIASQTLDKPTRSDNTKKIRQECSNLSSIVQKMYDNDKITRVQYNKMMADISSAQKAGNLNTSKGNATAADKLNAVKASIDKLNKPKKQEYKPEIKSSTANRRSIISGTSSGLSSDDKKKERETERLKQDEHRLLNESIKQFNDYTDLMNSEITDRDLKMLELSSHLKNGNISLSSGQDHVIDISVKDITSKGLMDAPIKIDQEALARSIQLPTAPKSIYDSYQSKEELKNEKYKAEIAWYTRYSETLLGLIAKFEKSQQDMLNTRDEMALKLNEMRANGVEPSGAFLHEMVNLEISIDDAAAAILKLKDGKKWVDEKTTAAASKQAMTQFAVDSQNQRQQDIADQVREYKDLGAAVGMVGGAFQQMGDYAGETGKQISHVINSISSMLTTIGQVIEMTDKLNQLTQTSVSVSQAAAVANNAEATSEGAKAVAAGAASGAKAPWPIAAAMVISIVGTILGCLSGVVAGFADGGIIGGKTTIGDMNLARVNKGEMILNGTQQSRLFNMLNGSESVGSSVTVGGGSVRIKGSDLYVALKNYSKSSPNPKTL